MSIRWKEKDYNELKRLAKNFNAKIAREEKKGIDKNLLPERVSAKDLKRQIATRRELERIQRQLAAFTKRGSTDLTTIGDGVVVTKYMRRQMLQTAHRINAEREKRLKIVEDAPKPHGKGSGWSADIEEVRDQLRPLNVLNALAHTESLKSVKKYARYLEKEEKYKSRAENIWLELQKDALIRGLGHTYPAGEADSMIAKLKNLVAKDFTVLYYQHPEIFQIEEFYATIEAEGKDKTLGYLHAFLG